MRVNNYHKKEIEPEHQELDGGGTHWSGRCDAATEILGQTDVMGTNPYRPGDGLTTTCICAHPRTQKPSAGSVAQDQALSEEEGVGTNALGLMPSARRLA